MVSRDADCNHVHQNLQFGIYTSQSHILLTVELLFDKSINKHLSLTTYTSSAPGSLAQAGPRISSARRFSGGYPLCGQTSCR